MKVYFHVGPHKSGTSSIQFAMRELFGSEDSSEIWYPIGSALGDRDGHDGLAKLLRNGGRTYNRKKGLELIKRLRDNSSHCQKLIISSENFSYLNEEDLREIREIFSNDEFYLIFTVSPFVRRIASLWNTQIQFGSSKKLEESLGDILNHAIFDPLYFNRFVNAITPDRATIIVTDRDNPPSMLLHSFLAALELPEYIKSFTEKQKTRKNVSAGFWELEVLRNFNNSISQVAHPLGDRLDSYIKLRANLMSMFQTPEWREMFPEMENFLPSSFIQPITKIAHQTIENINLLMKEQRVYLDGDLRSLSVDTQTTITNREKMHFLNSGKTGGYLLKKIFSQSQSDRYEFVFHPISVRIKDIPKGEKIIVFIRNPIERFSRAFTARQRSGAPFYTSPQSELERIAFKQFTTACELAESLNSDFETSSEAFRAIHNIQHLGNGAMSFFNGEMGWSSRENDIFFLGDADNLFEEIKLLANQLCLSEELHNVEITQQEIEYFSKSFSESLSDRARKNLTAYYNLEICFFDFLKDKKSNFNDI